MRKGSIKSLREPMKTSIEVMLNRASPLLSPEDEASLFQQLQKCRRRGAVSRVPAHWAKKAQVLRERIVSANLPLVVAMAGRTHVRNVAREELIAEGMVVLTRAVDRFEWERGFKFSTYATRALFNQFSRIGIVQQKFDRNRVGDFDVAIQFKKNVADAMPDVGLIDMKEIFKKGVHNLTEIELKVLRARFGYECNPMTLHALGAKLGLTKERIRQIQVEAIRKLRVYMELDEDTGDVIKEKF